MLHIHGEDTLYTCKSEAFHGPIGVRVHNIRLAKAALQQGSCGAFHLLSFAIAYIEVQLPSWRRPLCIHVRGVHVELRQLQMHQVNGLPFWFSVVHRT